MAYDFEKVGKETVLRELVKGIKGKADFLQMRSATKQEKLAGLKDLEKMSKEAHKILSSL